MLARAAGRIVGKADAGLGIAAVTAAVAVWIAYDDGTYGLTGRATLAMVVWWAVIVGLVLHLFAPTRLPRATVVMGGLIAALAAWTLASVAWAPSAEKAFNEFNRVSLYLGVFVLVVLAATRRTVGRWVDGLAVAIAIVAAVALVSRTFPGSFMDRDLATFLPSAATRLSFPLGYWNGLAIFVALGVPLLLRLALVARSAAIRGLALAPIPAMASVVYLTSSRGGVVTAFVGIVAFLSLTERRWSAAAAIAVSGAAAGAAVAALLGRDELVNGPLGTELVGEQGRSAALLIGLACGGAALVYGLGCRLLGGRIRPGRTIGRIAAATTVLAVVAGILASDPVGRFETFRVSPEKSAAIDPGDFVTAHLLSGSGSGRWQFWSAAGDQWGEHPVVGEGAGSYEAWWAQHATFTYFLKDAHSLYLETLGELGLIGFVLVMLIVLVGAVEGARRSFKSAGETRVTSAALTAAFVAFAAAAGFDWIWELTAVGVVGFLAVALLVGPATEVYEPLHSTTPGESHRWTSRVRLGVAVLTGLVAWIVICTQAVSLLADREIVRSQAAVDRRDLGEAAEAAASARDIQPWAATPYLQLALVSEETGADARARTWIQEAIERDERDWRLWLVSARLETKLGRIEAADRSLRRAVGLNPRSPLFAGLRG